MKTLGIIFLTVLISACSVKNDKQIDSQKSQSQGGVDVGNLQSALVPSTSASMSYPNSWSSSSSSDVLTIKNKSGSVVEAKKSEINDLSSPNAVSLQQYLKQKHPDRDYKIVNFNGFEGVRAELSNTPTNKISDLYLVSELKDFIHIQSDLKKADDGISQGEQIILTVRVKYQGVPYENAQVKTVTLEARSENTSDRHAYSLLGDCYTYSDKGCNPGGVAIAYERDFYIGTAGYDHGRVVELGPESQIPFDSIKVEGEYLIAPMSNIPISDIYSAFTPKDPQKDQDRISLKEGYVYLVRTISWPEEDLITKIKVKKVNGGSSTTITYQKLVAVKKNELQKQIELINKYTMENEAPLSTGEVMLYNRSVWNNYFYASFNFQYSTSGNMFITYNNWDLLFSNGCSGKPSFDVPHTGSGIGEVVDLGVKDLNTITSSDFPDPNNYKRTCGIDVIKGHTYAVYHYDYNDDASLTYGAVQVLDLDNSNKWVRLKFKRIKVGPSDYFQNWINLSVPQGIQSVTLEKTANWLTARFYPFINKRGDQGSHYYEQMDFYDNLLSIDNRPYGNKRGFCKLPSGTSIDNVSVDEIESLRGKFNSQINLNAGDVVAVLLENYYDKTVMIMKINSLSPDKTIQLSIKYLQRAKTAYSDDQ
ncbi:MAG: hypothetical protein ACXVCP_02440 [Bdellovibrio sp.]